MVKGNGTKRKTGKNNTRKTCNMLITSPEFTSNLNGKTYYTKSFDPLDCSTEMSFKAYNVHSGLLYVDETRQTLRSRMNKHRYDANDPQCRIVYNHFHQPGHDRCLTMKVLLIHKQISFSPLCYVSPLHTDADNR
jgi:hypothetical protein